MGRATRSDGDPTDPADEQWAEQWPELGPEPARVGLCHDAENLIDPAWDEPGEPWSE